MEELEMINVNNKKEAGPVRTRAGRQNQIEELESEKDRIEENMKIERSEALGGQNF